MGYSPLQASIMEAARLSSQAMDHTQDALRLCKEVEESSLPVSKKYDLIMDRLDMLQKQLEGCGAINPIVD